MRMRVHLLRIALTPTAFPLPWPPPPTDIVKETHTHTGAEEEMEAYRMHNQRSFDPMAAFLSGGDDVSADTV